MTGDPKPITGALGLPMDLGEASEGEDENGEVTDMVIVWLGRLLRSPKSNAAGVGVGSSAAPRENGCEWYCLSSLVSKYPLQHS